ncbi:GcrA cell cycle regulator [Acetobacter sp. DmW_043]|uniref:GcrA family cell cycle regulator n=1 Tax=Acetobacter sp. DmW_043 TaxID=1670658 RepID=UPI000A3BC0C5|nr:GcrA family cell cycle regulator [Acetobacter sp. DmW_043]OUI88730.1 GcrA cell cycle regulator [Acetobacter sp. DmW_043]
MEWTEETISRLKELWTEGLSTAEIGRRLSITKNAVVGKAHRLGLPARPSPIRRSEKKPVSASADDSTADKTKTAKAAEPAAAQPRPEPKAAPRPAATEPKAPKEIKPAPVAAPVQVAAPKAVKPEPVQRAPVRPATKPALSRIPDPDTKKRRGPSCCWPIGDPGTPGFHFCGATPLPGKPYCGEHAQIAYVKLRDRRDSH